MKRTLISLLLLLLIATLPGCLLFVAGAAAGVAVGGYAYADGKLTANMDATPDQIAAAIPLAASDLKLTVISVNAAEATARTADDTSVKIYIKPLTPKTSRVAIRVGTFGDENLSQAIFQAIKSHVPK